MVREGVLDRKLLAQRAFASPGGKERLQAITFPRILAQVQELRAQAESQGCPAVVLDAPTLFEAGLDRSCARILAVTAPEELRLARIVKRDHITEEQARLRFSAQKPGEFYAARGDYLVDTGGSTPLEEAVAPILAELTAPPEENSL